MEVLKDYPKEFAKLFRPSFNYLGRINMKFLCAEQGGCVRKYCRSIIIISCMVLNYTTQLWNLAHMMSRGKIFEVAYLLPPCLVSTQAILKSTVLVPKSGLVSSMIAALGALWRSEGLSAAQRSARGTLLRRMNLCNLVSYWVAILGSSQYLLSPLLETLFRRLLLQEECAPLLPLDCRYPFTVSGWVEYLAVYAFQVYSMSLCVCVYVGSELLMITLCSLLAAEYTLLCHELHPRPRRPAPACSLGELVARHQRLCGLAKELDAAFNQMIVVDLIFVGLTTCFFRYAAQFSRGPTYMLNNYVAVVNSLLNVLYLCYYGELLRAASLRIGDMAYHSAWCEGDRQHQKTILIIILRSQKPCCLTSMKYAPVTLNMFTKVMSSTWSYFSLMNTVYGDN